MRVDDTGAPVLAGQAHPHHLETVLPAQLPEQGHVALATVAEVEVLPHHHQLGVEGLDQHLADEVLGRLVGPGPVEGHHHGPVDAAVGQQLELLVQVGQERGRRFGPHHAGRVAVEGDHDRARARPPRPGPRGRPAGPGAPGAHRRRHRW